MGSVILSGRRGLYCIVLQAQGAGSDRRHSLAALLQTSRKPARQRLPRAGVHDIALAAGCQNLGVLVASFLVGQDEAPQLRSESRNDQQLRCQLQPRPRAQLASEDGAQASSKQQRGALQKLGHHLSGAVGGCGCGWRSGRRRRAAWGTWQDSVTTCQAVGGRGCRRVSGWVGGMWVLSEWVDVDG